MDNPYKSPRFGAHDRVDRRIGAPRLYLFAHACATLYCAAMTVFDLHEGWRLLPSWSGRWIQIGAQIAFLFIPLSICAIGLFVVWAIRDNACYARLAAADLVLLAVHVVAAIPLIQ